MQTVLLVMILLVAIALVGVILIQRSEGGAFGMGGGGTMGGFMTARGASNFLTRTTAVLATAFMGLSLLLAVISQGPRQRPVLVPEAGGPAVPGQAAPGAPVGMPALSIPGAPSAPPAAAESPAPGAPSVAPAPPTGPPAAPVAR
jgi:preprotein translocase subunit SecG